MGLWRNDSGKMPESLKVIRVRSWSRTPMSFRPRIPHRIASKTIITLLNEKYITFSSGFIVKFKFLSIWWPFGSYLRYILSNTTSPLSGHEGGGFFSENKTSFILTPISNLKTFSPKRENKVINSLKRLTKQKRFCNDGYRSTPVNLDSGHGHLGWESRLRGLHHNENSDVDNSYGQ